MTSPSLCHNHRRRTPPAALLYGFGLTGMKERAEKAGGSFTSAVQPSGLKIELLCARDNE